MGTAEVLAEIQKSKKKSSGKKLTYAGGGTAAVLQSMQGGKSETFDSGWTSAVAAPTTKTSPLVKEQEKVYKQAVQPKPQPKPKQPTFTEVIAASARPVPQYPVVPPSRDEQARIEALKYMTPQQVAAIQNISPEISSLETLALGIMGMMPVAPAAIARFGGNLAARGGAVGKAGQAIAGVGKAGMAADAMPGLAGFGARTAMRAGTGAAEMAAFQQVAELPLLVNDPQMFLQTRPEHTAHAALMGAGFKTVLGAAGEALSLPARRAAAREAQIQQAGQAIQPMMRDYQPMPIPETPGMTIEQIGSRRTRPMRPVERPGYIDEMRRLDEVDIKAADDAALQAYLDRMEVELGPAVQGKGIAGKAPKAGSQPAARPMPAKSEPVVGSRYTVPDVGEVTVSAVTPKTVRVKTAEGKTRVYTRDKWQGQDVVEPAPVTEPIRPTPETAKAKEPWEMTREEFDKITDRPSGISKREIPDDVWHSLQMDDARTWDTVRQTNKKNPNPKLQWLLDHKHEITTNYSRYHEYYSDKANEMLGPHEYWVDKALREGKRVPDAVVEEFIANDGVLPEKGLHPEIAAKYAPETRPTAPETRPTAPETVPVTQPEVKPVETPKAKEAEIYQIDTPESKALLAQFDKYAKDKGFTHNADVTNKVASAITRMKGESTPQLVDLAEALEYASKNGDAMVTLKRMSDAVDGHTTADFIADKVLASKYGRGAYANARAADVYQAVIKDYPDLAAKYAPETRPVEPVRNAESYNVTPNVTGKAEKPRSNTGLTKTQEEYLAKELESILPKLQEAPEPTTIKVPGDGQFTVSNPAQANYLHTFVSGKPLPGMPKISVKRTFQSTSNKSKPTHQEMVIKTADNAMQVYGHPWAAAEELRQQLDMVKANPSVYPKNSEAIISDAISELEIRGHGKSYYAENKSRYLSDYEFGDYMPSSIASDLPKSARWTDKAPVGTIAETRGAAVVRKNALESELRSVESEIYKESTVYVPPKRRGGKDRYVTKPLADDHPLIQKRNELARSIKEVKAEIKGEIAKGAAPTPKAGAPEATTPVEYRHSGANPADVVKQADDLSFGPSARQAEPGTFKVERESKIGRDYDIRDRFLQPLGIYDATGSPIQKGVYDRLGTIITEKGKVENLGTKVGQQFRAAEREMTQGILEADRTIEHIGNLVESQIPKRRLSPRHNRRLRDKAFEDFVDLIERPLDDAHRMKVKASDTPIGEALRLHDEMTDGFRNYIIESRRKLGINTPDDWGITDKGYFRHLFLGDIRLFKNGHYVETARTYAEAQAKALDIMKSDPNAQITAQARNTFIGDPTLRVSTRKYFRTVGELADTIGLSHVEIMQDLRGVIGRKSNKTKWFGALLPRKGTPGYSKAYVDVMQIHATQMYRSQVLSKLNHTVTPIIEKLRANGKPGLANAMEAHISDLWGTPARWEVEFGEAIKNTPVLRNHVAIPAYAFRSLAGRLTGLQYLMKLRTSPRSALINALQPYSTLWPYVTTKEFAAISLKCSNPKWLNTLREKGVIAGAMKLETAGTPTLHPSGSPYNPLNLFAKASERNRAMGYTYGYESGLKKGMTEAQAHNRGLSWAEKVEFDNSTWNVQALLRSPEARVLGQFKSFMLKNLENVREVWRPEGVPTAQRIGRATKWTTAQLGIGGIKSLGLVTKFGGGYLIVRQLSLQLQSYGMDKKEADKWAEAVYYGAPSLIGQDLSASVMIFEEPYGNTPLEQASNYIFGPTASTLLKGLPAVADRDWMKVAKAVGAPAKPIDVATQLAAKTNEKGFTEAINEGTKLKVGKEEYLKLSPFESVMRGLGFTPTKQSVLYDMKRAKIKRPTYEWMDNPKDKAGKEVERLGMKVNKTSEYYMVDGEKVELTDEQAEKLQRRVGNAVRAAILARMASQSYKQLSDKDKAKALDKAADDARAKVRDKMRSELGLPPKAGSSSPSSINNYIRGQMRNAGP